MLHGKQWEHLVPKIVVAYLKREKLIDRFIKEFGGDVNENPNL